jgi:hypothetical protein
MKGLRDCNRPGIGRELRSYTSHVVSINTLNIVFSRKEEALEFNAQVFDTPRVHDEARDNDDEYDPSCPLTGLDVTEGSDRREIVQQRSPEEEFGSSMTSSNSKRSRGNVKAALDMLTVMSNYQDKKGAHTCFMKIEQLKVSAANNGVRHFRFEKGYDCRNWPCRKNAKVVCMSCILLDSKFVTFCSDEETQNDDLTWTSCPRVWHSKEDEDFKNTQALMFELDDLKL